MSKENPHVLVLGSGSVGKRHMKNFSSLGCGISAVDPSQARLEEAGKVVSLRNMFLSVEDALLHAPEYDAVVVASPPKFHVSQTVFALACSLPVLLEKPLAKDLETTRVLEEIVRHTKQPVMLGYTYRWWPSLIELRRKILSGEIGRPLHASFIMSAHLADWHPWERYQDFFMASSDLGGGALLDESHWIDLMVWFFGMPKSVYASVSKISDLEIDTDDNVDMVMSYNNGMNVYIHLDIYGRPHKKHIMVVGGKGTIEWDFEAGSDRNMMFMDLARDFLAIIRGEKKDIPCGVEDGINVLKIIESARISSFEKKTIVIS